MNYQKIHNSIIEKAFSENRVKGNGIYYELHHIIPRCIGGTENKDNLVLLTAREHFIIHKLLCEIYPDNIDIFFAYWMMCNMKSNTQERSYNVSNREYERARIRFSESISKINTGDANPAKRSDVRGKISQAKMGHTPWNQGQTKETNDSIAQMAIKQKTIKRWNAGLTKDDPRVLEQSKNSSLARRGQKRGKYKLRYLTCPHCNLIHNSSVITRYHMDKCKYKL